MRTGRKVMSVTRTALGHFDLWLDCGHRVSLPVNKITGHKVFHGHFLGIKWACPECEAEEQKNLIEAQAWI